jgi:hypothetical protein
MRLKRVVLLAARDSTEGVSAAKNGHPSGKESAKYMYTGAGLLWSLSEQKLTYLFMCLALVLVLVLVICLVLVLFHTDYQRGVAPKCKHETPRHARGVG